MSPTALEHLALYFSAVRTRQGILARAALGTPGAGDAALALELAGAMSAELRPDGTIMGGAVPTIWRAHELLDLGRDTADPALVALLAWLMGRQGQPGAYGEGCDKTRHAQRICGHWARGFFSPAPAEVRVAPITLPNGKAFRVEPAARLAISCLGLRATLRAGLGDRPGPKQHLESLCLLAEQWTSWNGSFAPDVIVAGLHALALGGPEARASVEQLVGMIAAHQAPDGLWPNADLFATLEALHATGLEAARTAVGRALPALAERQRADGTFGVMAQQERALIGLRAIRWANPEVCDRVPRLRPGISSGMTHASSAPTPRLRLTALSHGAGCACKLGSVDLEEVLRHLPSVVDPRVLVDAATRDDAAVFKLSDDRALVATTDFFTPIVDNPRAWGAIAAANALSDVYAMGGTPLFALNLVGWPREKLPFEVLGEVLAGAAEITERARCLMLGGHSIDVLEPLFGLVVIGEVHPDRALTNAGACAGDVLILTKPLGTGILATALKRDALIEAGMADAVRSMTTLNEGAARAALAVGVSAATDVTGFGLLGHLGNILAASKVGAEIAFESLPILPHALNLANRGIVPGGTQRNLQAAEQVAWADDVTPTERILCVDAQTSGGLLLAVPPENEAALLAALREAETPAAAVIGRLTEGPTGHIRVTRTLA